MPSLVLQALTRSGNGERCWGRHGTRMPVRGASMSARPDERAPASRRTRSSSVMGTSWAVARGRAGPHGQRMSGACLSSRRNGGKSLSAGRRRRPRPRGRVLARQGRAGQGRRLHGCQRLMKSRASGAVRLPTHLVVFAEDGPVAAAGLQPQAHAFVLAEPGPSFQGGGASPKGAALSACFTWEQVSILDEAGGLGMHARGIYTST